MNYDLVTALTELARAKETAHDDLSTNDMKTILIRELFNPSDHVCQQMNDERASVSFSKTIVTPFCGSLTCRFLLANNL